MLLLIMKEFDFYEYYDDDDKVKIYGDDISNYFENKYDIRIDSIDFDQHQNVILYIEDIKNSKPELEKLLMTNIEHLSDIEIKKTKIILTFNCKEIELY